jgi:hypothetical protein
MRVTTMNPLKQRAGSGVHPILRLFYPKKNSSFQCVPNGFAYKPFLAGKKSCLRIKEVLQNGSDPDPPKILLGSTPIEISL